MTGPANRYKLQVNLAIVREEMWQNDGCWRPTQERLNISEDVDLGALDFIGVMGVLGRLHDSVTQIKPAPNEVSDGTTP